MKPLGIHVLGPHAGGPHALATHAPGALFTILTKGFARLARPAPRLARAAALGALACAALVTSGDAQAASGGHRLEAAAEQATVRLRASLPWRDVPVGREVPVGVELSCPAGCRLALSSGGSASFGAGSRAFVAGPRFVRVGNETLARRCDVLELRAGELELERPRARPGAAPQVVSLPSGRQLAVYEGKVVALAGSVRSVLAPEDGIVEVQTGDAWSGLTVGRLYELGASGPARERAPVPAPNWQRGTNGHRPIGIATDEPQGTVSMRWTSASTPSAQRLVVTDDDGKAIAVHDLDPADRRHSLSLAEGRYEATLRVADRDGIWSSRSKPQPLRVVRMALPDGGIAVDDGTFLLPDGTSLRMVGTAGIDVAIGKGGYLAARRELPVLGEDTTWLRIRMHDEPQTESRFLVEKRELRADIVLGPHAAVWPEDVVNAKVKLSDPSGRIDPTKVKPRFRVRVGSTDVPAHFTFDGKRWHARIHGRRLRRPQLLEVVVDDGAGHSLGRAFLEIATSRPAKP